MLTVVASEDGGVGLPSAWKALADGATPRTHRLGGLDERWAFKYPGRLGDSPVIGAGNYCDDRYGAAA